MPAGATHRAVRLPLPLLACLLAAPLFAAGATSQAEKPLQVFRCDTVSLSSADTLIQLSAKFLVAGSWQVNCGGEVLADSLFELDPVRGTLLLKPPLPCATLVIAYRAWAGIDLPDSFSLRRAFSDTLAAVAGPLADTSGSAISAPAGLAGGGAGEGFRLAGFEIQGSKSVSVAGGGPSGGAAFDQNLLLTIDGKLSAGTRLSFRLNDQDLPLASAGRSAELRELDEISVRLSSPAADVYLGDYDFRLEGYRFANIERKLDGASGRISGGPVTLGASAALGGGAFRSLRFNGAEGRQGPYPLTGANGEPVRVLAGTEKVWLDGRLLQRGLRGDYVVDYNLGTLTFTDRQLIGADSRIEVDYEYSSFAFKKGLYSLTAETAGSAGSLRAYFLRESDLQDSPLGGQFTTEELAYLDTVSSGTDSLLLPGVRFLGVGRGSYRLKYDAAGKPFFEFLGSGNGDYMVSFDRVGLPHGSYEFDQSRGGYVFVGEGNGGFAPAGAVAPPLRDDRLGAAFRLNPLSHLTLESEGALLKRTLNLFTGDREPFRSAHHLELRLDTLGLPGLPAQLSVWALSSRVERGFSFQGRRYEAEFERRWHLLPLQSGADGPAFGEKTREAGAGLRLFPALALNMSLGRLTRTNGERADRKTYGLAFTPGGPLSFNWTRLDVRSRRAPAADTSGPAAAGYRQRDNAEARLRWGILTPAFFVEREELTAPDLAGGIAGARYLEVSHRLGAEFSPRFNAGVSLLGRDTDQLPAASGASGVPWQAAHRSRSAQLDLSYQGRGPFRLTGRLGHRRRTYTQAGIGRTASTAGRVEMFGGGWKGAMQSHLVYEVSHGSSLRNRVVYLPERYPDDGEYLQDGTFVGKTQGTHRREVLPAEVDPRQAATLNLTARETLDLTAWVDSTHRVIDRMSVSTTLQLRRESTLEDSWRLYLLLPSAISDRRNALLQSTWLNSDLTVQWADPQIYSRIELLWNSRFDRRFETGYEEFADRTLRLQLRLPLAEKIELDPTLSYGRRLRRDLAGGRRRVSGLTSDNQLVASPGDDWRVNFRFEGARFSAEGKAGAYSRLTGGAGLTRFVGEKGRLEVGAEAARLAGPPGTDLLLVDVLGSARPGASYQATAAVSFEPGENMLIHVRYTGRTDYLLDRFTHFGRAEMKYFF